MTDLPGDAVAEPSIDDWLSAARGFAASNSAESTNRVLTDLAADRK